MALTLSLTQALRVWLRERAGLDARIVSRVLDTLLEQDVFDLNDLRSERTACTQRALSLPSPPPPSPTAIPHRHHICR